MGIEGIGARVARKEDKRFITGTGRYVDDMVVPGMKHAHFVRSPHAHAKIKEHRRPRPQKHARRHRRADRQGAEGRRHRQPDLRLDDPFQGRLADEDGRLVAAGRRHACAMSAMRSRSSLPTPRARRAMPPKPSRSPTRSCRPCRGRRGAQARRAADPSRGRRQPDLRLGDRRRQAADEAAFAKAAHVTKIDIVNNRLVPNAMEPRAALGHYDKAEDHYTCWTTSQNPHVARLVMSAFYNVAPENKLRVIAPDVGGGFGSKIYIYPEEIVCLWASKKTGVPVKWVADRTESLPHRRAWPRPCHEGRRWPSTRTTRSSASRSTRSPISAPTCRCSRRAVPTYLYATLLSGQYDIPAIHANVRTVYTNTAPVDAYRGAGRPEATYLLERTDGDGGARARRVAGRTAPQELHHAASRTRRRSSCAMTPATTTPRSTRR